MSEPEHLQRLNPEQYQAVTRIHGPVLVLAGAGSGKTRVLTRRIAHLLYTGVSASNVLAMTFTNKAATEMRERVEELIGEAGHKVWVSTFHSACIRILRQEFEAVGLTKRFAIYDDDDQAQLLRQIVKEMGREPKEASEFAARIDWFKNRMMSPADAIEARRSHVGDPLIRVWQEYEEALRAADAIDYNDIIGKTVHLFQQNSEVLARWRERLQYVLVDEYQDTNRAQYLLLRLLADEHRNLAAVGDDDQSIYGFRGADVSNILNFQKDFPEAVVVRLEQNYRSTGNILQLANAVVAHNTDRLEKKLWTQSASGPKIQLIVAPGPREEGVRVADAIQKVRRMGVPYGDIAIIYRTNAVARHFEAALRAARIPHKVVGGRKFYERREIRDVLGYLRILVNPADDAAFLRVVNVPPRGVGPKTQLALRDDAQKRGQPLLATARVRGAGTGAAEKGLGSFVVLIDELTALARDADLPALVQAVIERSGYRAMIEGEGGNAEDDREVKGRLENLDALIADARAVGPPPGAVSALDHLTAWLDRIALTADADEVPDGGQVTLLTAHSAKGLEYPVVFVVQMNEGMFPHERNAESGLEEERRLAYVAFTRAMQRLIVTRSLKDIREQPAQPSRFLFGVPTEVLDGDLPTGDPEQGEHERRLEQAAALKPKLATFLEHHRARRTEQPEGHHTLIDLESMEQLYEGVRILHPRLGVGRIVHVVGNKLRVSFAGSVQVIPTTRDLRIVAD